MDEKDVVVLGKVLRAEWKRRYDQFEVKGDEQPCTELNEAAMHLAQMLSPELSQKFTDALYYNKG